MGNAKDKVYTLLGEMTITNYQWQLKGFCKFDTFTSINEKFNSLIKRLGEMSMYIGPQTSEVCKILVMDMRWLNIKRGAYLRNRNRFNM